MILVGFQAPRVLLVTRQNPEGVLAQLHKVIYKQGGSWVVAVRVIRPYN